MVLVLQADFPIPHTHIHTHIHIYTHTHTHTHTHLEVWQVVCVGKLSECVPVARAVLSTITHIPCTVCTIVAVSVSISFLMYMILLTALRYKMPICSASGTQCCFPVWFVSVSLFCSPEQCCSFYILEKKELILALKVEHSVFRMHMLLSAYTELHLYGLYISTVGIRRKERCLEGSVKKTVGIHVIFFLFKMWRFRCECSVLFAISL